jgi:Protein of unknown function (DUF3300)
VMRFFYGTSNLKLAVLLSVIVAASAFAQNPNQYPQVPPQEQQLQQYPPQGQYPPQQGQYPPQPNQYPPPAQYPTPAQYPPQQYPPPPVLGPQQLDQLVGPVALYPDGLLAQVFTASTYSNEIPEAAAWANGHQYIKGDALAQAIRADNLNFDPSVMALLPFPSVLSYMAQYIGWTQELGNAVLSQRDQVMDAVQRLRHQAYDYGYLRSNQTQQVLLDQGSIEVVPVSPDIYYVPYYNPVVVFGPPRPGFYVGGAIHFGPVITIGAAFAPWGWGGVGFGWSSHAILIDHHPWVRTWGNGSVYVHPYAAPYHPAPGPRAEHHEYRHYEAHEKHEAPN